MLCIPSLCRIRSNILVPYISRKGPPVIPAEAGIQDSSSPYPSPDREGGGNGIHKQQGRVCSAYHLYAESVRIYSSPIYHLRARWSFLRKQESRIHLLPIQAPTVREGAIGSINSKPSSPLPNNKRTSHFFPFIGFLPF